MKQTTKNLLIGGAVVAVYGGLLLDHAVGAFPDNVPQTQYGVVGGKMPDYRKDNIVLKDDGFQANDTTILTYVYGKASGGMEYLVAFSTCQKTHLPFGVYEAKTARLYLDNNPTDGTIDKIVENAGDRKIRGDIPPCPI